MRVYLDSRDLIVLVERKTPEATACFEEKLRHSESYLIYSMHNIVECCTPLIRGNERSTVMRTLNRLEKLPHLYVAETRIEALELNEAKAALLEGREYAQIDLPIVPRFDYAVSAFSDCPTKQYLNYSLAHIIYDLYGTRIDHSSTVILRRPNDCGSFSTPTERGATTRDTAPISRTQSPEIFVCTGFSFPHRIFRRCPTGYTRIQLAVRHHDLGTRFTTRSCGT